MVARWPFPRLLRPGPHSPNLATLPRIEDFCRYSPASREQLWYTDSLVDQYFSLWTFQADYPKEVFSFHDHEVELGNYWHWYYCQDVRCWGASVADRATDCRGEPYAGAG